MNNSEGQTQEPVGLQIKEIPEVGSLDSYINVLRHNTPTQSTKLLQELFWSAIDAIQKAATPPPAPIKTEGEDAEQAAANWQKQNEKYMPDEQSESMLYDSFMAGVQWKSAPLPQSSTEEEKDLIIAGLEEGSELWKAEYDNCRAILTELVYLKNLKDSAGKTEEYEQRQPLVWITAKKFLEKYQHQ